MDIKATAVQFAPRSLEVSYNLERMVGFIEAAVKDGSNFVVFPELSDTGYVKWPNERKELNPCMNTFLEASNTLYGESTAILSEAAKKYNVYIASGLAEKDSVVPGRIFNSAVLINPDGKIIGVQRKNSMTMAEPLYFTRGNDCGVFDTDFGKVGMLICYDNFFPEQARVMALNGMTVLCSMWAAAHSNPPTITPDSCIPTGFMARSILETPVIRALENVVFSISASRVGKDEFSGGEFLGNSAISAPWGDTLIGAGLDEEKIITEELQFSILKAIRCTRPLLRDRRPELYTKIAELTEPIINK